MIVIAMIESDKSESCAICGERVDVLAGPALVTDTGELVCSECGWAESPELAGLVETWEVMELAVLARQAMEEEDDD